MVSALHRLSHYVSADSGFVQPPPFIASKLLFNVPSFFSNIAFRLSFLLVSVSWLNVALGYACGCHQSLTLDVSKGCQNKVPGHDS
jgi:hypothetical protein